MACEVHLNDEGTIFRIFITDCITDLPIDLSSATLLQMLFKNNTESITKTGSHYTDGTNHAVEYTAVTADLDVLGKWKVQAKVTFPTGIWYSEIQEFKVFSNVV